MVECLLSGNKLKVKCPDPQVHTHTNKNRNRAIKEKQSIDSNESNGAVVLVECMAITCMVSFDLEKEVNVKSDQELMDFGDE